MPSSRGQRPTGHDDAVEASRGRAASLVALDDGLRVPHLVRVRVRARVRVGVRVRVRLRLRLRLRVRVRVNPKPKPNLT